MEGPGGLERRVSPPITTYPPSGRKDGRRVGRGEHVAAGLNTSLRQKRWEMVARLRMHCVSFWEGEMGNVGAVNDLCVICAVPLESTDVVVFVCVAVKGKKKKEKRIR